MLRLIGVMLLVSTSLLVVACSSNPPLACGKEMCTGDQLCVQGTPGRDAGLWCGPTQPYCGLLSSDKSSWVSVNNTSVACMAVMPTPGSRYAGCACS